MAHFAELDSNNVVIDVVVVHNNILHDEDLGEVKPNFTQFYMETN
jgi:hypothetical protein